MPPAWQAARQVSCRAIPFSWLGAAATTCVCDVANLVPRPRSITAKHQHDHDVLLATYATFSSSTHSAFSKTPQLTRPAPKGGTSFFSYSSPPSMLFSSFLGTKRYLGLLESRGCWGLDKRPAVAVSRKGRLWRTGVAGATGGCVRSLGGQSVVPWELALFLVEEMKGEGIEPGAVVYTAALAECRWAGQERHVEYLVQQMNAEGISIVPGIPGATDNELPPSQAPPLFGKLPEAPPGSLGSGTPQQPPDKKLTEMSSSTAVATRAAKTADTALATVEAMWAGEQHEPSPATCRAALDACAAGGQWERALSLVRDAAMVMAADADGGATGTLGGLPNESLSERVEVLALEAKWDDALLLIQGSTTLDATGGGPGGGGG